MIIKGLLMLLALILVVIGVAAIGMGINNTDKYNK